MSDRRDLQIESILGTKQLDDALEFEIALKDREGNIYLSRFTVRNHNVGLFNRALRKLRPLKILGRTSPVPHTFPKKPGSVAEPGTMTRGAQ